MNQKAMLAGQTNLGNRASKGQITALTDISSLGMRHSHFFEQGQKYETPVS